MILNETPHFEFARQHSDVAWLSQNTNHLVVSPAVYQSAVADIEGQRYIGYAPAFGLVALRHLIRDHLKLHMEQEAYITQGATEAINVVMRAIFADGGELITSDPGYEPICLYAKMAGASVQKLPVYHAPYHMTVDAIEEAITPQTKAIAIIDPSNPLGSVYPEAALKAICALAKKHDLWIINDVTYFDFSKQPYLAAHYYPEKTFTIYSLSKCAALAGLRIGAVMATMTNLQLLERYWAANLGANIMAQDIGIALMESFQSWFPPVLRTTESNQALIVKTVSALEGVFCPVEHASANVMVIDISGTGLDSFEVQEKLLYHYKVFVRNGYYTSQRFGADYIRVSFSNQPEDVHRFCRAFKALLGYME